MSLVNRLLTPAKIKEAAGQVFTALLTAPPGVGRAVELPIATGNADEDLENSLIVVYLMKEKPDHIMVSKTSSALILQLSKDFAKHSTEGKELLIDTGRTVQTDNAREIIETSKKLKT